MPEFARMRDIKLNDPVSIEMPAHVWLAFLSGYYTTKWNNQAATAIALMLQDALIDPLYLREQQAHNQQHQDDHRDEMHRLLGFLPDVPPNREEPT